MPSDKLKPIFRMDMMMTPQASIEKHQLDEQPHFTVSVEHQDKKEDIATHFSSFQDALGFIVASDWQLKREAVESTYVEMRFFRVIVG